MLGRVIDCVLGCALLRRLALTLCPPRYLPPWQRRLEEEEEGKKRVVQDEKKAELEPSTDEVVASGGRGRFYLDHKPTQSMVFLRAQRMPGRAMLERHEINSFLRRAQLGNRFKEMTIEKLGQVLGLLLAAEEKEARLRADVEAAEQGQREVQHKSLRLADLVRRHEDAKRRVLLRYMHVVKEASPVMEEGVRGGTLQLAECGLGDEEAHAVAALARGANTLEELSMRGNAITDEGARAIAAVLAGQSTVKQVDLRGNRLSETGVKALAEALERSERVRHVYVHANGTIEALGATEWSVGTLARQGAGPDGGQPPSVAVSTVCTVDCRDNDPEAGEDVGVEDVEGGGGVTYGGTPREGEGKGSGSRGPTTPARKGARRGLRGGGSGLASAPELPQSEGRSEGRGRSQSRSEVRSRSRTRTRSQSAARARRKRERAEARAARMREREQGWIGRAGGFDPGPKGGAGKRGGTVGAPARPLGAELHEPRSRTSRARSKGHPQGASRARTAGRGALPPGAGEGEGEEDDEGGHGHGQGQGRHRGAITTRSSAALASRRMGARTGSLHSVGARTLSSAHEEDIYTPSSPGQGAGEGDEQGQWAHQASGRGRQRSGTLPPLRGSHKGGGRDSRRSSGGGSGHGSQRAVEAMDSLRETQEGGVEDQYWAASAAAVLGADQDAGAPQGGGGSAVS